MAAKQNLKHYRDRRDLRRTGEPAGTTSGKPDGPQTERPRFVIQKHNASNLHYDFRLEVEGVLKSWAVPKGPSTDPREKRLALQVEDHPLEYADFEGVIPEGEYGAGAVLVWDAGPYRNIMAEKDEPVSVAQAIENGQVEVYLYGHKIRGGYALVRTGSPSEGRWLLIKVKDDEADARRNPVSTEPASVLSGMTIEEIAEDRSGEGSPQ